MGKRFSWSCEMLRSPALSRVPGATTSAEGCHCTGKPRGLSVFASLRYNIRRSQPEARMPQSPALDSPASLALRASVLYFPEVQRDFCSFSQDCVKKTRSYSVVLQIRQAAFRVFPCPDIRFSFCRFMSPSELQLRSQDSGKKRGGMIVCRLYRNSGNAAASTRFVELLQCTGLCF
jgi:hypothetical protein